MADTCTISATLRNQDGTPRPGVTVSVYVLATPVQSIVEREKNYVSDEDGVVSMPVWKGLPVRISILGRGISRELTVPSDDTADLFDLLADQPDPFQPVAT